MPGNNKVRPESLIGIRAVLEEKNPDIFKAIRSGRPLFDRLKTLTVGILTSVYFRVNLMDSGGSPSLVSEHLVNTFLQGPDDYSYEAFFLYMARRKNYSVIRSPILYSSRLFGESHWQQGIKSELSLLHRIMSQKKTWKKLTW
jgi:hypothetical protein